MSDSTSNHPRTVDVLIVGGGPVGLLIAYQLARFGCDPYLVERQDKSVLPCYGRACTLWPRTMELLDQLDLAEDLLQQGVVTRSGQHFVDGQRTPGGFVYAHRMDKLGDTFYKFALHIRQKKIESQFSLSLKRLGRESHEQVEFLNYTIHEKEEYPVEVHLKDLKAGKEYSVFAKHLVGCDGGSSVVRSLPQTGVDFSGDRTKHRWIRMDARVKTNMPNSRYLNSVDSPTHGQLLWCPIDSGMTRIGYVFSDALIQKYGGIEGVTEEAVLAEAKAAMKPFELEFLGVDWWTIYGIGQRLASSFTSPGSDNRVLLAGDACHTHSSGSAQGLNTGVHDAINMAWKLAFTLKGRATTALTSYDTERKAIVQQVIDNDRIISTLVSGQYPEEFKGSIKTPHQLLTDWFSDANKQSFTLGLGISYAKSPLNYQPLSSLSTINAGDRGPDAYLSTVGLGEPIRLLKILKNHGEFTFLVFAGEPQQTKDALLEMKKGLLSDDCWLRKGTQVAVDSIRWVTVVASTYNNGGQEILGLPAPPFNIDFSSSSSTPANTINKPKPNLTSTIQGTGSSASKESGTTSHALVSTPSASAYLEADDPNQGYVYLDSSRSVHDIYGIDTARGSVVIFRPDSYVAGVVALEELASAKVGQWLGPILGIQ